MKKPTVRLRRLGSELRRLRKACGLTADDVAARTGISTGGLSRIENGAASPKARDLDALLDTYELADAGRRSALHTLARDGNKRGWWQTYQDQITHDYADLISLEDDASYMRSYETTLIPGLLQTAGYARAVLGALSEGAASDVIEAHVAVRQARQSVLTRPTPLQIHAIVHEAALRHRIGPPHTMRDQLQRLADSVDLPNVVIQVLPYDAPQTPALAGGFAVIGWGQPDLDVALVESLTSALYVEEAPEVRSYTRAFETIAAAALAPDDSVDLIVKLKDSFK